MIYLNSIKNGNIMEKKITHGNFLKNMSGFPQDQKNGGKTCAATSLLAYPKLAIFK